MPWQCCRDISWTLVISFVYLHDPHVSQLDRHWTSLDLYHIYLAGHIDGCMELIFALSNCSASLLLFSHRGYILTIAVRQSLCNKCTWPVASKGTKCRPAHQSRCSSIALQNCPNVLRIEERFALVYFLNVFLPTIFRQIFTPQNSINFLNYTQKIKNCKCFLFVLITIIHFWVSLTHRWKTFGANHSFQIKGTKNSLSKISILKHQRCILSLSKVLSDIYLHLARLMHWYFIWLSSLMTWNFTQINRI